MILLFGAGTFPNLAGVLNFPPAAAPTAQTIVMSFDPAFVSSQPCSLMSPVGIVSVLLFGDYLDNIYDILIALVFGFSSLSVLGLAVSRADQRRGLNFGEVLAVTAVVVSVGLWGWEMLQLFHIFPIKLRP